MENTNEENQEVVLDEQNNEEEVVEETEVDETEEETTNEEEITKLKKENGGLKRDLKKAQKSKKTDKTEVKVEGQLSQKDLLAVMEAKVPAEDLDEVVDYSKLKGISVTEALKAPMIKSILETKAEERQTADATNVKGSKRKTAQVSTDTLLENAEKGEYPENDKDIERLIKAEKGLE